MAEDRTAAQGRDMGYVGNVTGATHYDHSKGLNHMESAATTATRRAIWIERGAFACEGPAMTVLVSGEAWLLASGRHPLLAGLLALPALVFLVVGWVMTRQAFVGDWTFDDGQDYDEIRHELGLDRDG